MANGLTSKQRAFVGAYLGVANGNATEAARLAGYKDPELTGWENRKNPVIRAEIDRVLNARSMSAEEVVSRLAEQARGEHTAFVRTKRKRVGEEKETDCEPYIDVEALLAAGKGHLIKGIKMTRHGTQVEFYDAQAALALLARHHGLLTDRLETNGTISELHVYLPENGREGSEDPAAAGGAAGDVPFDGG